MRRDWAAAIACVMVLSACGVHSSGRDFGTPSVHEFARLQASGQLDAGRVDCVMAMIPWAARTLPLQLEELRQARAAMQARAMGDHARSVQQGMLAADVSSAAAYMTASLTRQAASLESAGYREQAATVRSWSADVAARAVKLALDVVRGPNDRRLWTEEEVELLIEYADLMEPSANLPAASEATLEERSARVGSIQATHPHVMDRYARMLLAFYRAPDVDCMETR